MIPVIVTEFLEGLAEGEAEKILGGLITDILVLVGIEKKPVAVPENPNPAPATETKSPDSVSDSPDSSTEKAVNEISESVETPTASTNESIDEAIKKEG